MKAFAIGLCIGLAAGVAIGLAMRAAPESTSTPTSSGVERVPPTSDAEGADAAGSAVQRPAEAGSRSHVSVAAERSPATPAPNPHAIPDASSEEAYQRLRAELIRLATSGLGDTASAQRAQRLIYALRLANRDPDLPQAALRGVLEGPDRVRVAYLMGWSNEHLVEALHDAARAPADGPPDPRWPLAFGAVSTLNISQAGTPELAQALLGHGNAEMRRAGIELATGVDPASYDQIALVASDDPVPAIQRRAIVALRSRAGGDARAQHALESVVSRVLVSPTAAPEVRTAAVESVSTAGSAVVPAVVSMLGEGGLPADIETSLIYRVVEFESARLLRDVELSPEGTLALISGVSDADRPDVELMRELRPRVFAVTGLEGFADSQIVMSYAAIGDVELGTTIARDSKATAAARVTAALDIWSTRDHIPLGASLGAMLASEEEQPVAVRRALARRLQDVMENGEGDARSGARALAERMEAQDSSYWVRAAATAALSAVRE